MLKDLKDYFLRRDTVSALLISGICVIILLALFSRRDVLHMTGEVLHEVRTFDAWSPAAYQCPTGNMPVAMPAAFMQAPPIMIGEAPPELVKGLGIEVVPVVGGKVKITGVMGNSWADKAGLKSNDIILRFNKKKIKDMEHFKALVAKAPPEKDYKIKVLRGAKMKSMRVTVGEGEMEGFTPIVPVAFGNPMGGIMHGLCFYQCPRCANLFTEAPGRGGAPNCPLCNLTMSRVK